MRRAACIAAMGGALLVTGSCRQIVGIEEKPAPPSLGACGLSYGTSECAGCVASSCCSESSACEASPACKAFETCAAACKGDPQCRSQCSLDDPPGTDPASGALSVCLASHCEMECGLACGAATVAGPKFASSCEKCLDLYGCTAERMAAASPAYVAYQACRGTCGPASDCLETCGDTNDAGMSLSSALGGLLNGTCASQCGWGQAWSCVGRIDWPKVKSATVQLTVQVTDVVSGVPYSGVDVSVCAPQDLECATPLAPHDKTDATGRVVFQVPNVGDNAQLGLNGYLLLQPPDMTGIAAIGPVPPGVVDVTATPLSLMKASTVLHGLVVKANAVTAITT